MWPKKWLCKWNGGGVLTGFETDYMEGFIVGVQQGRTLIKLHGAVGKLLLIWLNVSVDVKGDSISTCDNN